MYPVRILVCCVLVSLTGCAAQTGIPGHGGGKRFAVEQELVAAAARSAIKQIDLGRIRGRKVNLYVNAMGDAGAGNLMGGRFSIISQLHGDYMQTPQVRERYVYPRYDSHSSVSSSTDSTSSSHGSGGGSHGSNHSSSTQETSSSTLLPAPVSKTTRQEGGGATMQVGMEYKGLGAYHNSEEITSDDLQYLSALLQTYLFLQGVVIVPPSEAEVDVYVIVDVFGTVYTRVDWFLANNEILRAKTALEVFAVDTVSGEVLMPPQSATAESEYNEQYILWAGPIRIRKSVNKAEPLLSDFSDAGPDQEKAFAGERTMRVPVPFGHGVRERRAARARGKQAKESAEGPEKKRKRFGKGQPAALQ